MAVRGNSYLICTEHLPLTVSQKLEQQSAPVVHFMPSARHSVVLGEQLPALHTPSQQSPSEVHAPFNGTHTDPHLSPPLPSGKHSSLQHSSAKLQSCPSGTQVPGVPGP